jgi:predicted DCC family thiol-disulfide oxidoreductase YuxK
MAEKHWLIWDGECGLCSSSAHAIRRRDAERKLQICSYQNCPRPPMTDERLKRCSRELLLVTPEGQAVWGSRAVITALALTGSSAWRLLLWPPIVWLMMAGYWLVARNRGLLSKLFFGGRECGLDNRYPEVD